MTKVRLTQQQQGTRDGQPWPEPGTEVDLPDAEAQALISGGAAVDPSDERGTVLVPPLGVHTPGRVAMPPDATSPLVETAADAVADPAKAREAVIAAQNGEFIEGPPGVAHQHATGLAHTAESLDKAAANEQQTREAYAVASPRVGDDTSSAASAPRQSAKASADPKPAADRK